MTSSSFIAAAVGDGGGEACSGGGEGCGWARCLESLRRRGVLVKRNLIWWRFDDAGGQVTGGVNNHVAGSRGLRAGALTRIERRRERGL